LVIGAAGMIGRKFCEALAKRLSISGKPVDRLTMADAIMPAAPPEVPFSVKTLSADISDPSVSESLAADRPDIIYHLAAVVSGEAEADFDKGYRVNLGGVQHLFEAVRRAEYRPRVVFASSIAVFGTPFPEIIPEEFAPAPLTSYGTQKAIGELLLADFSRRGFFDGIGLRLPTICVRPGKPNKAASGFFSSIIREPLNGETAVLPVADTMATLASSASIRPSSCEPSKTALKQSGASSKPATTRSKIACTANAVNGVFSDGFQTTALPQTSASAAFHAQTATGKLNAVMTPHTPIGCHVSRMW